MAPFINFTELYNSGGSFAKQEVLTTTSGDTTVTTVYGGYAPCADTSSETDARPTWLIRRLVVIDTGTTQNITCTWARGSWNNRASLEYKYFKPE